MSREPHYIYVDVPVVNGVAVLPDHSEVRSTANVVRVPVLVGVLPIPVEPDGETDLDSLGAAWSELEGLAGSSAIGVFKTVGVASGAYVATTDLGRPQDGYAYGDTPVAAVRGLLRKIRGLGQ